MLNGLTLSLSVCQFTDNEDTVLSVWFGLFLLFGEGKQNIVKVLTLHFQWEFLP